MNAAQVTPDWRENLVHLHEESFEIIAVLAGAVGFVWLYLDAWALDLTAGFESKVPASAWIGAGLLALSAVISNRLKGKQLAVAQHMLVWGILASTVCAVLAFPSVAVVHLFILPVIFASVLLNQPAFFSVAGVSSLLVLAVGPRRPGAPFLSPEAALPVAIVALVTVASWLSVRNLYTTLAWVWSGYDRARRNEQMIREQQAELRRALKALDEANRGLERTNYMLVLARNEAEEARRLKQQFAQNISHELRTPLNLIIGFSETMVNAPETYRDMVWPPSLRGDVEQIYRSSRHLASLIDDVLDLSALEARRLGLVVEEVNISDVIEEAASVAEGLFRSKGLYLKVDAAPDLPSLRLDPIRIRQVLLNLLSNASRYTHKGGVTITARQLERFVQVAVADTGVGIAAQDIPKVFEEFRQLDGSTRRKHGGTGLGLPLSKRLIELHGGQMWLESAPGTGSRFCFTLPIVSEPSPTIEQPEAARPTLTASLSRKGLLVVEPDPILLHTLRRYLDGYDVIEVSEQQDLRALVDKHQPVALVVDNQDKGLLAGPPYADAPSDLPVVAFPLGDSLGAARALGVRDYLVKPVTRPQLLDAVERLGEEIHSILIVDDEPQLVELLSRMLQSAGKEYRLSKAFSGESALNRMRRLRPDLVLLDLRMPDKDGLSILESMRADPVLAGIPVIVVSAQEYLEAEKTRGGHALGIVRRQEFSIAELLKCLQSLLDALPLRVSAYPG